jgi:uncharacterized membrane protein
MSSPIESGLPANRIEALSDGIFAVAMTILVLEIHVPELPHDVAPATLVAHLIELWPKAASFAIGFVVLGTIWVGHHIHFHYLRRVDRTLLWINLVLLLSVSALPFCVALLGAFPGQRLPSLLYGAVVEIAFGTLLALWTYATSNRRLVAHDLDARVIAALRRRVVVGIVGYGAGLSLALVAPQYSLLIYGAMPILYLLPGRIDTHVNQTK